MKLKRLLFVIFACASFMSCEISDIPNQNVEKAALDEMLEEILEIANSVPCTDASEWDYTAYGSKACGGPQGYLAYSKQLGNIASFLVMVEEYTKAEHDFNIRWDVISTCDLPAQPTSVSCENGEPVLNY